MNDYFSPRYKIARALNGIVLLLTLAGLVQGQPNSQIKERLEPAAIPIDQFAKLHTLIKPQAGELRFHDIPWLIDVWEARNKAAAEGKPIFVWSGAGGAPIGVC